MFKTLLISVAFLFISIINSQAQTFYGVNGIIKTPSAYIVENGKCTIGMAYYNDDHFNTNEDYDIYTVNFNAGFHSRFDIGVRLAMLPDVVGDSKIYDAYFDRMLNTKFVLFKEKKKMPQIAIGMQDMVGTRLHNSTYVVVSKTLKSKALSCNLNVGYGSDIMDKVWGEKENSGVGHNFLGVFGSTEIGIKNRVFLAAEYDAKDLNAGLKVMASKWLSLNVSMLKMEKIAGGLSFNFTL